MNDGVPIFVIIFISMLIGTVIGVALTVFSVFR